MERQMLLLPLSLLAIAEPLERNRYALVRRGRPNTGGEGAAVLETANSDHEDMLSEVPTANPTMAQFRSDKVRRQSRSVLARRA
jgi:hypothetical protein